jgi:hypothetical protein
MLQLIVQMLTAIELGELDTITLLSIIVSGVGVAFGVFYRVVVVATRCKYCIGDDGVRSDKANPGERSTRVVGGNDVVMDTDHEIEMGSFLDDDHQHSEHHLPDVESESNVVEGNTSIGTVGTTVTVTADDME